MFATRNDLAPTIRAQLAAIAPAAKAGDAGTSDLITAVSCEVGKYLWFLEAHLQGTR